MILANDFRRLWGDTRDDALRVFAETGESGWYVLGRHVAEFETALAAWWGCGFACGVASGLDAIEISLRMLGCRAGDRVLTTPLSAFATTLAIVKCGAVPVFVDTDEYGLIDLTRCEDVLTRRPEIRFMVPVHLYGHALDGTKLKRLRDRFDLKIVEDCAQSIGASWAGIPTGLVGQCAAVSFYPTKNLGAMGDGGAVLTGVPEMDARARMFRDYGQAGKYRHEVIGYNSRLDEVQAALLGNVYLPRLAHWTIRRREIARAYLDGIHTRAVKPPGSPAGSDSCWHLFPVCVENKPEFIEHLTTNGIVAGEHYPILIPDQRALADVTFEVMGDLARARAFAHCEVSLPLHPYLHEDEITHVIETCKSYRRVLKTSNTLV